MSTYLPILSSIATILMLGYASLAPQPTAITVAKFLRIGISG